jgi:thiosulfate/3-mercaptopyruvate sulfurtransferase
MLESYLVTPAELQSALLKNAPSKLSTSPRIIPLCAAWFMPNDSKHRTGKIAFEDKRIPSARYFDLDAVIDPDSAYPHMLPTAEVFAGAMSDLGLKRDDTLVVYDTHELGIFSAPRVAWTLRVFGHPSVHILNNFKLWVQQGYPTSSGPAPEAEKSRYPVPTLNPDFVASYREMKSIAIDHGKEGSDSIQVIDARSQGRFEGTDPEPRKGLSSGHIPGSANIPLPDILHPEDKTILPPQELKEIFKSKNLDPKGSFISTCGTGVTAAAVHTALGLAGYGQENDRRVYDGGWT